ncbi:MAG: hypothetical protein HY758_07655 [Nitrospirae bacterium]|nr:hypothetical protein [Nitrospirota bacterium]
MIKAHCFYILNFAVLFFLVSCSQMGVEEYFRAHGMTYPVDAAEISAFNVEHAGIKPDKLLFEGADECVESGIIFIKDYLENTDFGQIVPGAKGAVLGRPLLYMDESGGLGLTVKVVLYGDGKPGADMTLPVEIIGHGRQLWRVENFAYFSYDDSGQWHYGGWLY